MHSSFEQHFMNAMHNGRLDYIKAHYDVKELSEDDGNAAGNILSSLWNALVWGINQEQLLPKVIVIVLDDDLLDSIDHFNVGISLALGRHMEWLVNELHSLITDYKKFLPSRSRKFKYPTIIWTLIQLHDIYGRFN